MGDLESIKRKVVVPHQWVEVDLPFKKELQFFAGGTGTPRQIQSFQCQWQFIKTIGIVINVQVIDLDVFEIWEDTMTVFNRQLVNDWRGCECEPTAINQAKRLNLGNGREVQG